MNHGQHKVILLLIILSVTFVGCKSTKSNSGAGIADARAAAIRVLSQFEAGEFSQIYKEAAPVFKQTGPEANFVAQFQQTLKKTGTFKNQKESSHEARPDDTYVLTYRLENDRFISDIHLTFTRSKNGKMELAGIHEHDDPKK
jgi:hypothetical protein